MSKLTRENLPHFKKAIVVGTLAPNFQDAILITHRLGFSFLWIDALCIIQNCTVDWAKESQKMVSVFGNATLMISAMASPNSNTGILVQRSAASQSPRLGSKKDRYIRVEMEPWVSDIDNGPLSKRGWAAQERILAPRILHYTSAQMMWECSTMKCAEESERYTAPVNDSVAFSKKKEVQVLVDTFFGAPISVELEDTSHESHMRAWGLCVSEYTRRDLTFRSDKLPAIAGLASIFGTKSMGNYLAGIWDLDIGRSLAWSASPSNRSEQIFDSRNSEYRAPSWSWASNMAPVDVSSVTVSHTDLIHWPSAHKAWSRRHSPKLIESHILEKVPKNPYMEVLEGSYIVIEGSCCDAVFDERTASNMGFKPIYATVDLDRDGFHEKAPLFLRMRKFASSRLWVFNVRKPYYPSLGKQGRYVCLQLMFSSKNHTLKMLALEAVGGLENAYRRVGVIECKEYRFGIKALNDYRWETRRLRLV